jgi:hypothetical protein
MRGISITLLILLCLNMVALGQATQLVTKAQQPSSTTIKGMQILEHPQDAVVCTGATAYFSVRVAGNALPKFQWQSSVDGNNWNDVAGANTSMYDGLRNMTKAYDGLAVRVKVRLESGQELISDVAKLIVDGELACTKQPSSQLVVEGGVVTLSAEFSSKGKTWYQWQYSPYGSGIWLNLDGEQNQELKTAPIHAHQSGAMFRVTARSEGGCDSTISQAAFIEVVQKPYVQLTRGLDSYCGGGSSTFTIKMRGGTGHENVHWQESIDGGKTFQNIKEAYSLSYTINRIQETMAGYKYRAQILLPGGLELYTSDITITVHGAVAFNEQPKSQYVCPGDQFMLEAKTDFKGSEPTFVWQISTDSIHFTDIEGKSTSRIELGTKLEERAPRYYRALVSAGQCQSMISDIARIQILSVDGIEPKVQDAMVTAGDSSAVFTSNFQGDGGIYSCTWQWSANDGATWQTMSGNNPTQLALKNISKQIEGSSLYRLKILNKICYRIYYSEPAKLIFAP